MKKFLYVPSLNCTVAAKNDEYLSYWYAVRFADTIESGADRLAMLGGKTLTLDESGERAFVSVKPTDGGYTVSCGSFFGFETILNKLQKGKFAVGTFPITYDCEGDAYALADRQHRVMYSNVLWDNDILHYAPARNRLTAAIVKEYAPEIVGMQECGQRKRKECGIYALENVMSEAGYVEARVQAVNNCDNVNCTPIFYNPDAVRLLDCGYYWYENQCQLVGRGDQSSKSLTWGRFRFKNDQKELLFVTTHMCTQDDDVREKQAMEAEKLITSLQSESGCPVIFGGDFNGNMSQKNYRYLTEKAGWTDVRGLVDFCSHEKGHHAHPEFDFRLEIPVSKVQATEFDEKVSVDHALTFGGGLKLSRFAIINNYPARSSSDHYPLYVDFEY